MTNAAAKDLGKALAGRQFGTVLADPPWQFANRTGKIAPEHRRLSRYGTMQLQEIMDLPVRDLLAPTAHLYLWCPNALLPDGLAVMQAWGFTYKSNLVWHKVRKDGGSDGRGVGFYFRNVTELILFGVRGKNPSLFIRWCSALFLSRSRATAMTWQLFCGLRVRARENRS